MTIVEDLAVTAEICGGALMSEAAALIFVSELRVYPEQEVHAALARCRREVVGRLALAHVIERIDDGRPGAEEAWAMLPKDENDSGAITADMAEVMGPALSLLRTGDGVQARMAFVEAYRKRVSQARANRETVSWRATLGFDKAGREAAQLDVERRLGLPTPERTMIEGPVDKSPELEPIRRVIRDLAEKKSMERAKEREDVLVEAEKEHAEGRRCAKGCDKCWPTGEALH